MMYGPPESEPRHSGQYSTTTSHRKLGDLQPDSSHIKEVLGRRTRPLSVTEEVLVVNLKLPVSCLDPSLVPANASMYP
ncbi:hypothetical protein CPB86DRAFT_353361 [Serendipita vermifera]|nr:hypothetical protein CPB86DRAFT_353361 [Serendipita vermifera]